MNNFMVKNSRQIAQDILSKADIQIDGNRPWDIQVHNSKVYRRVLSGGYLAIGESYMDGWWDAKNLDQFYYKIFSEGVSRDIKIFTNNFIWIAKAALMNMQSMNRSKSVAELHYDLGNDFYKDMLDKRMLYTCGYWKTAKTLDKAQEAKLDLICRKIKLKKTDKVLDLGCGWGSFAKYAAQKYGCQVTSVNISKEQVDYAKNICKGLPVKVILSDYRNIKGTFDKVVAIGLAEHVGYKNYRRFMEIANQSLKKHGIFLLHTIGRNNTAIVGEPWFDKYIFRHGMMPSLKQLGEAMEGLLTMEDWHNFGADYDKTLMVWYNNFNKNWPKYQSKYGERFYRMWKYYLLSLAGAFRARHLQLWQIVLSKGGIPGGYVSVR